MGRIYAKATQVLVWLDQDHDRGTATSAYWFVKKVRSDNEKYFSLHQRFFAASSKEDKSAKEVFAPPGDNLKPVESSKPESDPEFELMFEWVSKPKSDFIHDPDPSSLLTEQDAKLDSNSENLSWKARTIYDGSGAFSDLDNDSPENEAGQAALNTPPLGIIKAPKLSSLVTYEEFHKCRSQAVRGLVSQMEEQAMSRYIRAFLQILSRPWWQRCWTLQEAVLGSNVVFLYGDGKWELSLWDADCAFSLLCRAYEASNFSHNGRVPDQYDDHQRQILEQGSQNAIALRLHRQKQRFGYIPASELFFSVRQRGATDKRDLVYSILGLIDPAYGIQADYTYSNTVSNVFTNATIAIILKEGSLDFINQACERHRNKDLDLPSWVPDLTARSAPFNLFSIRAVKLNNPAAPNASFQPSNDLGQPIYDRNFARPTFLSEEGDPQRRVLQCKILGLGQLAREILLLNEAQNSSHDTVQFRCTKLARELIGKYYTWTEPPCHQSLDEAVDTTLSAGFSSDGQMSHWSIRDVEHNKLIARKRRKTVLYHSSWRFFVTPDKKMGLCPPTARRSDVLCIALGSRAPWILRPCTNRAGYFIFIGPCYLHGYMQGQAIVECTRGQRVPCLETVRLI